MNAVWRIMAWMNSVKAYVLDGELDTRVEELGPGCLQELPVRFLETWRWGNPGARTEHGGWVSRAQRWRIDHDSWRNQMWKNDQSFFVSSKRITRRFQQGIPRREHRRMMMVLWLYSKYHHHECTMYFEVVYLQNYLLLLFIIVIFQVTLFHNLKRLFFQL